MSETPNEEQGDGSQSGQPEGGQPQGVQQQNGQPQGGHGQPQGRQAPPQGGQPQGQPAPAQTGPSVGDIFSRPDTMTEIKVGIAVFAMIGAGLGIGVLLIGGIAEGRQSPTPPNGSVQSSLCPYSPLPQQSAR